MRALFTALLVLTLALPASALQNQLDALSRGRDPFIRSLFWPGLGQIEQGRSATGALFAGGAALTAMGLFKTHIDYHSASKDFDNAGKAYADALEISDTDTARYYYEQLEGLHRKADERYDTRRVWQYGLAAVWVANLADVWWHGRGGSERVAFLPVAEPGGGGLAVSIAF